MPNTSVKLKNAIVPGLLAGCAFQALQYFYINSQIWISSYNAIYGSFAAIPLFMLWTQLSWSICLFGVELTYTNQNAEAYYFSEDGSNVSHRCRLLLSALLMSMICRRFSEGKHPYTALEMSRIQNIPIRLSTDLLYDLVCVHLIIEVVGDDKGDSAVYLPYEDIGNLNVGVMVDRLESYGKESLDLNYKNIYNEKWRQMLQNRVDFLNTDREILLKDL